MSAGTVVALASVGVVVAIAIVGAAWHLGQRLASVLVGLERLRVEMGQLEITLREQIRAELAEHVRDRHPRGDPSLTGIPLQAEP